MRWCFRDEIILVEETLPQGWKYNDYLSQNIKITNNGKCICQKEQQNNA